MTKQFRFSNKIFSCEFQGIVNNLLRKSEPSQNTFVVQVSEGQFHDKMDHLTCFLPGMLALGAQGSTKERDIRIAKELMETCYDMYACTVTGLSPEVENKEKNFLSVF
jgi:hypothetical protein